MRSNFSLTNIILATALFSGVSYSQTQTRTPAARDPETVAPPVMHFPEERPE